MKKIILSVSICCFAFMNAFAQPSCQITLSSAVGSDAQSVSMIHPITNITYSVTGATGVSFAGLPLGVSGSFANGVATIKGTPLVGGTYNYTITTTGTCVQTITGAITSIRPSN